MTMVATTPSVFGTSRIPRTSPDEIHNLYRTRANKQARTINAGKNIRKVYNGEWETILPELESKERTQVANLIQQGIDAYAQRISSIMPTMTFPPERNSGPARQRASERRQVVEAWHELNRMPLLFHERARYLIAYGSSPIHLRFGSRGTPTEGIPVWDVWDPLCTYPAPGPRRELVPIDTIYAFKQSWAWLNKTYNIRGRLPLGDKDSPDLMIDCLLYCDDVEETMIAVGKDGDGNSLPGILLQTVPNPAGRPLVIVPQRITLDRLQGQFDQMIGMYESQGLLWAMHLQALKRSIFAETWLEARPQENPQIIAVADPIQGDIGVVEGGVLQNFHTDPSVQTGQTLDRTERNMRQTGGIPAELGGESGSNIRTARRGTQVLSSAVDFPIQEHQDILAASLQEENRAAIAIVKAYAPDKERTLYVAFGDGQVTYTPSTTFPYDQHSVRYAFSGTDAESLVVQGLQRVGAGTLSEDRFMEIDPLIDDPIFEKQRVVAGQIEKALISSIQQQAADPNGPYQPADIAQLISLLVDKKMPLQDAVAKLHEQLQARQEQAAQGQLQGAAAQPGLSVPGAPGTPQTAQAGPPAPTPDQAGLAQLMSAMRGVQRGVPGGAVG